MAKILNDLKNNVSLANNLYVTRGNPVSLIHFVTNRCNARCSFCFIDFDNPEVFMNELTTDEIRKITLSLGPNLQNVNLTGGEPFARKDLVQIASCYFQNTNIRSLFITSNGSLPERVERFCQKLTEDFPDRKVLLQFSIDDFPNKHDEIRKIKGLFENCMESYRVAQKFGTNIQASIAITISHENFTSAEALYDFLILEQAVKSISLNIVRDEGVYKIPLDQKKDILGTYMKLTKKLDKDMASNVLTGWNKDTVQGRLMNQKNKIWRNMLPTIYMDNNFISPCRAGAIFGIIEANGKVKPCEILDTEFGNIRDYNYNFMELWKAKPNLSKKRHIVDSKCNCHYDCAWSFNILSNLEFQTKLWPKAVFPRLKG